MSKLIKVSEYTTFPGPRFIELGPYSGEDFRDSVLIPALLESGQVAIDLDGTMGYGSSFLEESFGGLVRKGIDKDKILFLVSHIKSEEEPNLIQEIQGYVEEELNKKEG